MACYQGKTCVVTEGSSRMGEEVAPILSEPGAVVYNVDIQAPKLPCAQYHACDMSDINAVRATAEKLNTAGPIHFMFPCAGLAAMVSGPIYCMRVNYIGTRLIRGKCVARPGRWCRYRAHLTSPFCLYDCDRFSDASTVLIISAGDVLDEVTSTPIRIAASAGRVDRWSWDQPDYMACYDTGPELWAKTDNAAANVDVVQFYDGLAFFPIGWLEALRFCAVGEGHEFVDGGHRIARDGELPFNTSGGQLGSGRLHGFGFAYEAVVQLRGDGGARQVTSDPKIGIATSSGGPLAAALLLANDWATSMIGCNFHDQCECDEPQAR